MKYLYIALALMPGIGVGCKEKPDSDASKMRGKVNDTVAGGVAGGSIGPRIDVGNERVTVGNTRMLVKDYAHAVARFYAAYGADDPYMITLLRSSRFISRKAWDENKVVTQFNPIIATDKYNFEHENGICRLKDLNGNPTNVWDAFERAALYVNDVMHQSLEGKELTWSESYKRLNHVKNWFSSEKREMKGSSPAFDLDVIHSIHAANGEGATQNDSGCGKIAQFKVCDGMKYSPFFHPDARPTACRMGSWTPSAAEWTALVSHEMRQIGQFVVPVPHKSLAATFSPVEYGGLLCGTVGAQEKDRVLQYGADAQKNDWPALKQKLPDFSEKALARDANYLGAESQNKRLAAFAMYASVEQIYKDIANYRLKPGLMNTSAECSPCGLKKTGSAYEWDDTLRGYCPQKCLNINPFPERSNATAKETDLFRSYFEPDSADPSYPSIIALLNQHFTELRARQGFSKDPVALATKIQQWFVAMHPYIDGDGRTSRFLMEMILHSVGLPFPVLDDFWADTQTSTVGYEQLIRTGIERHTAILNACSAYVTCMKKEEASFTTEGLCSTKGTRAAQQCEGNLHFSYGEGKSDMVDACDCATKWPRDAKTVKYDKCP